MTKVKSRVTNKAITSTSVQSDVDAVHNIPHDLNFMDIGSSGIKQYYGRLNEEWNSTLRGKSGAKLYREMSDNDATIGAMLFLTEMLCRSSRPYYEISENLSEQDKKQSQWYADKLEEMRGDMEHTWSEGLSDILTMMTYGFSLQEITLKMRRGYNPLYRSLNSKYDDGLIGVRRFGDRPQDSIDRWIFDSNGYVIGAVQTPEPTFDERTIPIEKCALFKFRGKKDNPEGRSPLRHIYRTWFFKKNTEEQEMIGMERGAKGLPIMEVPPGILNIEASPREVSLRNALKSMLDKVFDDSIKHVLIPAETGIDGTPTGFKLRFQGQGQTQPMNFDVTISRQDKVILRALVCEFLALGMDATGSYALSSDKTKTFAMVIDAILTSIDKTIDRSVTTMIFNANGWNSRLMPIHKHSDIETKDLQVLATFVSSLITAGAIVPDNELESWLRNEASAPQKKTRPEIQSSLDDLGLNNFMPEIEGDEQNEE